MKAIADTGFLVAFAREADMHHAWAVRVARDVRAPLLTCEAVLAETSFHLGSVEYGLGLVRTGMLSLDYSVRDHVARLDRLARQFADRAPDLADLCLICLSESHPERVIVTTDRRDFTVYRRFGRESLPLLLPPR